MLKKTITYNDLDGNPITEEFYFNLSKAEIVEMELTEKEGFAERLTKIVADGDGKTILAMFKEILLQSYGHRSPDGKRFIKSSQISEEFTQTDAYDKLFFELVTNAEASSAFIKGLLPADLVEQMTKTETSRKTVDVQLPHSMSQDDLFKAFQRRHDEKTTNKSPEPNND